MLIKHGQIVKLQEIVITVVAIVVVFIIVVIIIVVIIIVIIVVEVNVAIVASWSSLLLFSFLCAKEWFLQDNAHIMERVWWLC